MYGDPACLVELVVNNKLPIVCWLRHMACQMAMYRTTLISSDIAFEAPGSPQLGEGVLTGREWPVAPNTGIPRRANILANRGKSFHLFLCGVATGSAAPAAC